MIRTIEAVEARLAFRVRFPPRPPRNPKFREANKEDLVPAVELELLSYDDAIWWPFWTWHDDFEVGGEFNVDQLRRLLEEDYDICLFLPLHGFLDHDSGSIAIARKICRDDEDRNLSIAAEKVRANFLICDRRPYVRGGAPLYVRDWIKSERTFKLTVGEAGADRKLSPAIGTTFCYKCERRQETFRRGDFWLASDRETAVSETGVAAERVPAIEVFIPGLVEDISVQLRLDAIYRATFSIFERPPRVPRWIKKHSSALLDLLAPGRDAMEDAVLSNPRYDVLSDVLQRGIQYEPLKQLDESSPR